MGILDTLKWLWDPRTDEQKEYEQWDSETPLQKRTQKLRVIVKGENGKLTHRIEYSLEDWKTGMGTMRWASDEQTFEHFLNEWIADRATQGIRIDSVWYSPETIERIELGEQKLELIE